MEMSLLLPKSWKNWTQLASGICLGFLDRCPDALACCSIRDLGIYLNTFQCHCAVIPLEFCIHNNVRFAHFHCENCETNRHRLSFQLIHKLTTALVSIAPTMGRHLSRCNRVCLCGTSWMRYNGSRSIQMIRSVLVHEVEGEMQKQIMSHKWIHYTNSL